MSAFRKGDKVVQIQPAAISGEVIGFDIDQETGERLVLVAYADGDAKHERHFSESHIAKVAE